MSKETRTIRPFSGLGALDSVLETPKLRFGPDTCLAGDGITVEISPQEFLGRPASLEWASDAENFGEFKARIEERSRGAGFALKDVSLCVVASSSYLKIADILHRWRVDELKQLPRVIQLTHGDRPRAFCAPFSGFVLDVYLLLTRSLPLRPLRPHRLGTWLAHASFRVGTSNSPAVLPPTPLTDDIRARYGLPSKTVRYLDFRDHDVLQPYAQQEQPVFYVDEKLLAQMNARRTAAGSRSLQLQLAYDFVSAVLRRAAAHDEIENIAYEDVKSSLLGSALRVASGPSATDQDLKELLGRLGTAPEFVVARSEAFIDLISGYFGILEEPTA